MAVPSIVQQKSVAINTNYDVTVTFDSAVTSGNLIVAVLAHGADPDGEPGVNAFSDNKGNTYTRRVAKGESGSNPYLNWVAIYTATATTGGSSFTVTFAQTQWSTDLVIVELSGADTTTPVHISGSDTGYSTNPTLDLANTTVNDCIVFGAINSRNWTVTGPNTGWTSLSSRAALIYKNAATAGNHDPSWASSGNGNWVAAGVAIQSAAGATYTPRRTLLGVG